MKNKNRPTDKFSAHCGLSTRSGSSNPHLHRARLCGAVNVLAACLIGIMIFPTAARADDSLSLDFERASGYDVAYVTNQTSTGVPLQASSSATWSSGEVKFALDGLDANITSKSFIIYTESGDWTDGVIGDVFFNAVSGQTLTISTSDPALDGNVGTIQIDYRILGSFILGDHDSISDLLRVVVNGFSFASG